MPASSVRVPSPAIPVLATPLPSLHVTPQSTAQSTGSGSLPATPYETPCLTRHRSYSRRPASPASTVDSLEMLVATPERGRPCNRPQPPSYDDKPVKASPAELKKWK